MISLDDVDGNEFHKYPGAYYTGHTIGQDEECIFHEHETGEETLAYQIRLFLEAI